MSNLLDKIKSYITPTPSSAKERAKSLKELKGKTLLLEQQADYATAKATLLERAEKAKKRIKATRKSSIRPLYILAGLAFLAVIIFIMARGC